MAGCSDASSCEPFLPRAFASIEVHIGIPSRPSVYARKPSGRVNMAVSGRMTEPT